jgi:triosephosphate isomerase
MNKARSFLYVANWKMNMPLQAAMAYFQDAVCDIDNVATQKHAELIFCPSFIALSPLQQILISSSSRIHLGAQNCAAHDTGSFTGEVDALSLAQAHCSFCIVGHYERRQMYGETDAEIARKVPLLQQHNITPIVCIGENKEEHENDKTYEVLTEQLRDIFMHRQKGASLAIAYEPAYAIGTGMLPSVETVTAVCSWLKHHIGMHAPEISPQLLYGGSVNSQNSAIFKNIPSLDGLLIGKASLEWKQFRAIITV